MIAEVASKTEHAGLREALHWLSWRSLHHVLPEHRAMTQEGQRIQRDLVRLLDAFDLAVSGSLKPPSPISINWRYKQRYGFWRPDPVAVPWRYGGPR